MMAVEAGFPAEHASVPEARRFVQKALTGWGAEVFEWAAVTLVSELASNAVLHARTGFRVQVQVEEDVLRLAVSDESLRLPLSRHYGLEATTGRGLRLVRELSDRDGVELLATGKTVWCELHAVAAGSRGGADIGLALDADDEDVAAFLAEFGEPEEPTARYQGAA